ncbi:MAG: hypothetical protein CMO98_07445 [Woeseia sp.]|nr:hypothetical protein [Woeseia sp.]
MKVSNILLCRVLATIMVLSVFLTGCQQADTTRTNLSLLTWNGYQHPEYYPDYIAKYGGLPQFAFFSTVEDAMARMKTGLKVDVVHLCPNQMVEARDQGLIKPLDTSKIARWNEMSPELLALPDVRIDNEYWIAPWEWGYSTVAYNPEVIDVENPTYDIFVDPRFKGKTALESQVGVNIVIAGVIGGWAVPWDPTEEEMAAAPDIFTRMFNNARFIWTDSTQLEQAWAAGDVGISYIFGSATRRMTKNGLTNVIVDPIMPWTCGLSLSANGENSEEESYEFINAMLDPRSGAALFDMYGYGHGNSKSVELIDPSRVAGTGIDDPEGTFNRGLRVQRILPDKKARLFQLWFEAQAGLD